MAATWVQIGGSGAAWGWQSLRLVTATRRNIGVFLEFGHFHPSPPQTDGDSVRFRISKIENH